MLGKGKWEFGEVRDGLRGYLKGGREIVNRIKC